MESTRTLLGFGHFSHDDQRSLAIAASEAGLELALTDSPEAVMRRLAADPPRALVIDGDAREAEQVALDVRVDATRAALPIIAACRALGDLEVAGAMGWSADDVVRTSATRSLVRRLRALPHELSPPSSGRGRALVAEPDRRRRIAVGRTLRSAGFEIVFAVTGADATAMAANESFTLIVASTELVPDQLDALARTRAGGSQAAWIASAPPRMLGEVAHALGALDRVTAMDAYSSPDSVLFVANDLLHRRAMDHRRSARLLYAAIVAFRGAGRDEDDHGFSHNVSAGGLYVRTLAAPEDELVWLELTPPRSERRVRLVGKVAWRRAFGPGPHATVPPGFGVQIVDGARADLEAWRAGYEAFASAVG
jgi:DNA-binding response OmpR family regulator